MLVSVITAGSHGDVHPFIAVGRALAQRGHEVVVLAHPVYGGDLEAAGLEHVPVNAEVDHHALLRDPRLMHPRHGSRLVMEMILEAVPAAVGDLRREIARRRPDVFVAHHVCIGSRWACREAGVPLALVMLAPLFWISPEDPVPAPQRRPGPLAAIGARVLMAALRRLLPLLVDRRINRLRRETGFPPERGAFMRDMHGGDVNLGLWSPHFRPALGGDPPRSRVCGFPWYDRSAAGLALENDLARFLDEGEPPVVFSLGTAAVHTPGDFYEIAAGACARAGCRGVLLTGDGARGPADLPPGVRAFGYAPFSRLLPRAAATVHHGGIGSTAQALRAGRPSVVVAHAHDQFNNGVRVASLGAGAMIHRSRLTAVRLAEALRRVLDDPAIGARCTELGRVLEAEDGAAVAADAIERLGPREDGVPAAGP